jgi:hypothetical protein
MEDILQSTHRKITVASFEVIHVARPEVQLFSELLIQYPRGRAGKIRQVVPGNMVVVHGEPIQAKGSYDLPLQPVGPTWVMECVSKDSKRKDYEDTFHKAERGLKVPYYLIFYPEYQEIMLYHRRDTKYVSVKPNVAGRLAVPEVEVEVALVEGWARYWFRGELVPVTAELQRELLQARRQLEAALRRADKEKRRADEETHRANEEKLRADALQDQAAADKRELAQLRAQLAQLQKPKKNG